MADDNQDPGTLNISIIEGDPYERTVTFTAGGEPWELPTTGWLGQIRRKRDKTSELVGEFTIDASQAGVGDVSRPTERHLAARSESLTYSGLRPVLA